MPSKIQSLDVGGMFGYLEHQVSFRQDAPTIITGPNGAGKTYLLRILRAMVGLDFAELHGVPFATAELGFANSTRLIVTQIDSDDAPSIVVSGYRRDVLLGEAVVFEEELRLDELPPWVERTGPDLWWDQETGEVMTMSEVRRRYAQPQSQELVDEHEWLRTFSPASKPTFIETGRLDVSPRELRRRRAPGVPPRRRHGSAPIERYVGQIQNQIAAARRQSLSVSQRADRRFAARALDRARATVKESILRGRYQGLADLHHELHSNGLTDETIEVELPSQRTNPTERRILDVFLEDWEQKLQPLLPVHQKLNALRSIIDAKLQDKRLVIEPDEIAIDAPTRRLPVTLLSSGEQHMLALFTMFLFTTRPGALVLIDEPEISLHAAWKHAFLEDLERVVDLMPTQIVMATHSTALINSRWDLVEELEV